MWQRRRFVRRKREKQDENLEGILPHKKVVDGVEEEEDFSLSKQNLLEDKNGATKIMAFHPRFSRNSEGQK